MERQLADLYRGVAVLATADDEHLAALELLCLVMAVDTRLDESEIAAIREISTDWRDDLPPETPFEQLLGRAVTTAQTAVAEDRVTSMLDDLDQRISSSVLRRALFSAAREVAGADDEEFASETGLLEDIAVRFS
ncbi:MAG: TerB family tellurite resistance protein [Ilumatobacteraceae bacterium]|jgi:uncharacterized tellurite resistance protein B-like protein|nr:hypothetical protein [Actinomycetota bacterium]